MFVRTHNIFGLSIDMRHSINVSHTLVYDAPLLMISLSKTITIMSHTRYLMQRWIPNYLQSRNRTNKMDCYHLLFTILQYIALATKLSRNDWQITGYVCTSVSFSEYFKDSVTCTLVRKFKKIDQHRTFHVLNLKLMARIYNSD